MRTEPPVSDTLCFMNIHMNYIIQVSDLENNVESLLFCFPL